MNNTTTISSQAGEHWLVIAAHPDDDCMAAPLLLTERMPNHSVTFLVMRLAGVGAPYDRPSWTPQQAIESRARQMVEAAHWWQADLRWWKQPKPGNEEIVLNQDNIDKMISIIREIRPSRIVTHWGDDHPDHVATAEIVVAAMQQMEDAGFIELYRCDHPTHVLLGELGFKPNYYVDISNPSVLGSVLWARLVHRSLTNLLVVQFYLENFRKHGIQAGVGYAVGYWKGRIPRKVMETSQT